MTDQKTTDTDTQTASVVHKNVYAALAAAQSEMGPLVKGSYNPHFKTKYADLADLVIAVRGPFNRNGLAYFHQIIRGEGFQDMRTVLVHGETESKIECDVPLIVQKQDMQGMKSASTYGKRIGLESVSGVAPDDDDGNAATAAAPKKEAQKPQPPRLITADQFTELRDKAERAGVGADKICSAYRAESLQQLKADDFQRAMAKLQSTIDAKQANQTNEDPYAGETA